MRQLRKILEYSLESRLRLREVFRLTKTSKTTISEYLARFKKSGITYQESLSLSDRQFCRQISTTTEAHMPAHHQFYASWSAEKFTRGQDIIAGPTGVEKTLSVRSSVFKPVNTAGR